MDQWTFVMRYFQTFKNQTEWLEIRNQTKTIRNYVAVQASNFEDQLLSIQLEMYLYPSDQVCED